jgi:hypothetical protein
MCNVSLLYGRCLAFRVAKPLYSFIYEEIFNGKIGLIIGMEFQ